MVRTRSIWQPLLFRLALFWMVSAAGAWAQSGNGALRGYVRDADFSVPVGGVAIFLEGTGQTTTTQEDGSFFINDIPPGQYDLVASKEGFIRERRSRVVITGGSVKEVDVAITAEVVELDEYVVSQDELVETVPGTETIALRTELKTFTEVLGQQFISQTGASDASKLVGKLAGVNVADGRFVVVRGLNDRYNVVSLNSLRVPSSDPDRRAVALDLFPTAVIQDIRTSKTFLPDLNGESTGGTINIVTKAVPAENFARLKLGSGYNTQATGHSGFLSYTGGGTGAFGTAESRALPEFIKTAPLPDLANSFASGLPGGNTRVDHPVRLDRQRVHDALSPVMGTSEVEAPMDFSLEGSIGHRTEFMGMPAGVTVAADYSKKYVYGDSDFIGRYFFDPATGELPIDDQFGPAIGIRRAAIVRSGQETMRAGLLLAAGFEPDVDSEVVFTYFFNRVAEDRATLQIGEGNPALVAPTDRDYRESLTYTQRDMQVMQAAGNHLAEVNGRELGIQWAAAYNQSSQLEPDHRFVRAVWEIGSTVPNPAGVVGVYRPFPGNPTVPEFQRLWRELHDSNYSMRLDVTTDLFENAAEIAAKLKLGALLDHSERDYRADSFTYNRGAENQLFPNPLKPGFPGATWGDVFLGGNRPVGGDGDGVPNNSPVLDPVSQYTYIYRANDFETYHASQLIAGGYATIDFDLLPGLNLALGARIESTDIAVQATPIWQYPEESMRFALLSDVDRFGPDSTMRELVNTAAGIGAGVNPAVRDAARADPRITDRSRSAIREDHLLPALSVKWDATDTTLVRAAISRTIARPSFKELAPVVFLNVESGDLFVGNADLEMSEITNYDARWEWFPKPGNLVAVSFFAKHLRNPIEFSQEGGDTGPAIVRYVNAPQGSVYGLELEFQRDLGFIGEELQYFSIGANYSYIRSQATRPEFVGPTVDPLTGLPQTVPSLFGKNRRLQGQPDYILNFNLNYEHPDRPLSAGVFLNVTGPLLFAVGGKPEDPDVLQEPVTTLDLGVSYRLSRRTKVSFRAQNILNARVERYFNNKAKPMHSTRQTGIGFSVSVTGEW